MSKPKRNASGGLIADLPGGYESEYGLGHPFRDSTASGIYTGVPPGFRISPSELRTDRRPPQPQANGRSAPPGPRCCYGSCWFTLADHERKPPRAGTYHERVWRSQVRERTDGYWATLGEHSRCWVPR